MKKITHILWLLVFLVVASLGLASGFTAHTTYAVTSAADENAIVPTDAGANIGITSPIGGIQFPIAELGNCENKSACHTYCSDTANIDACVLFAKTHGLMNKDEATSAKKFKDQLQSTGGPGGCKTPEECHAFCSDSINLRVCVSFAKDHGLKDKNTDQGEKVLRYLAKGGHMPGNCDSKDSCKTYCSDFNHTEECMAFNKNAGISQSNDTGNHEKNGGNPPQIDKFLALVKNNQTPGGCNTKEACETYCAKDIHRQECLTFAVSIGILTQEQADNNLQDRNKGPGGCDSQDSCRAYCNDQTHRDECYAFGESHGLIDHAQTTTAKDGLVRLRSGLENAPPEVTSCIISALGDSTVNDIQSGKLVPGPDVGSTIKSCFEKFGQKSDPAQAFKKIPSDVLSCLKEKVGTALNDIVSNKTKPTPEIADAYHVCSQKVQLQNTFEEKPVKNNHPENQGNTVMPGPKNGLPPSAMLRNFLKTAPTTLVPCIKEHLGVDFDKIVAGEETPIDTSKVKGCFDEFRPQFPGQGLLNREGAPQGKVMPKELLNNMNPKVQECIKSHLGDVAANTGSGEPQQTPNIDTITKECIQKFTPDSLPGVTGPSANTQQTAPRPNLVIPSNYLECVKSVLGEDGQLQLRSGQVTQGQKTQIITCMQSGNPRPAKEEQPTESQP